MKCENKCQYTQQSVVKDTADCCYSGNNLQNKGIILLWGELERNI